MAKIFLEQKDYLYILLFVGYQNWPRELLKKLKIEKYIESINKNHSIKTFNKLYKIVEFCNELLAFAKDYKLKIEIDNKLQKQIDVFKNSQKNIKDKNRSAQIVKNVKISSPIDLNLLEKLEKIVKKKDFKIELQHYKSLITMISEVVEEEFNPEFDLYSLQFKSVLHHLILESACNFSVPGIGKTIVALTVFAVLKKIKYVNKLLIIGPLNSYIAWKDEYCKFFKRGKIENILEINSEQDWEKALFYQDDYQIYLINYAKISSRKKILKEILKKFDFFLILDEAHKIKNSDSQRTQTIWEISEYVKYKLILTGTPMPKNYEDLYSYFNILKNKDVNYKTFNFNLKDLKQISKKPDNFKEKIEIIKNEIDSQYIRITKKELKLKPIKKIFWKVKNDIKHQQIYEDLAKKTVSSLFIKDKKIGKILKAKIFRLMQISIDPRMIFNSLRNKNFDEYNDENSLEKQLRQIENSQYYKQEKGNFDYQFIPNRYYYCLKKIDELFIKNKIKKVIIWSCWVYSIKQLLKLLKKDKKYNVKSIYGITDYQDRENYFHDFQKREGSIQILICNPASVSESVSLHYYCHDAIYFDMTWNAIYYLQSKERIHRYQQTKQNQIKNYFLINNQTIDKEIWKCIFEKEKRMLEIVENGIIQPENNLFESLIWEEITKKIKNKKNLQEILMKKPEKKIVKASKVE